MADVTKNRYPAYPEYKDSGVEWLNEIPKDWVLTRLKYSCPQQNKKSTITPKTDVIALENIEGFTGKYISTNEVFNGEDVKFIAGDVLFGRLRPYLAKVFYAKKSGIAFGDLLVYRPNIKSSYAFYQMISPIFLEEVNSSTYGTKMPRASTEFINNMPFLSPSQEEQQKIANFLDHETAKIDELIGKQERLIALLKEKRQAVISHAVTKGLNPNAPMKYSGVEWLGEIPEHWDVIKLSYLLLLESGSGITSQDIESTGDYPVFGGNGIRGYTANYNCDGNYALIGRQGALCGNINIAKGKFFASEHAVVAYPYKEFNLTYLAEFLRFMNLGQYSVSAAQPGLSVDRINQLPFIYPPIEDQNKIGKYIDNQISIIEKLTNKANEQITLLKERRTALISAAVTGKIDLRDWNKDT